MVVLPNESAHAAKSVASQSVSTVLSMIIKFIPIDVRVFNADVLVNASLSMIQKSPSMVVSEFRPVNETRRELPFVIALRGYPPGMGPWETTIRIVAGVILLLGNAFFVVTEFALTRLRQHPKSEMEGSAGLERAWEMTERLEIHLTGCQLGISLTSILLGIITEPAVTQLFEPLFAVLELGATTQHTVSIVVAVIVINLAHKIWGEQAPTYLGVERPLQVARVFAPVLDWWTKITYPLIWFGDGAAKWTLGLFGVEITRSWADEDEEQVEGRAGLKRKIGELLSKGELDDERQQEVLNALDAGETTVREIMVPREEIVFLSLNDSVQQWVDRISETWMVRYPVIADEPEDFRGMLYVPALIAHHDQWTDSDLDLEGLLSEPFTVDGDLSVADLIDDLQQKKQEAALVLEDDRVVGFVTQTDAFESIVGELEDPFDEAFENVS